MSLWAIVPVKPIRRGKSRLAGVLSEEERTNLNTFLFEHTMQTLVNIDRIDQILVISRDPSVLSLARRYKTRTLQEDSSSNLNLALKLAARMAQVYETREMLVIPADLPLVTTDEINQFLNLSGNPPEVIIAPDRHLSGTNALYINPIAEIEYHYGPNSYQLHVNEAETHGYSVKKRISCLLGFDLDLPEDLDIFYKIQNGEINPEQIVINSKQPELEEKWLNE